MNYTRTVTPLMEVGTEGMETSIITSRITGLEGDIRTEGDREMTIRTEEDREMTIRT